MRRALVVGIDNYGGWETDLSGCINDANSLLPLLQRNDDDTPNFHCEQLLGEAGVSVVLREDLYNRLQSLFAPGADIALLYFAGHGERVKGDVALVTSHGTDATPGVRFTEVLEMIAKSPVAEVVIMLDCCFSGGAGAVPALASEGTVLRSGVSILTASRAEQVSVETTSERGAFSTYLEAALKGGAADILGNVTVASIYAYLTEAFGAWEQRPMFKANVDRLQNVRTCGPSVPLPVLRRLPDWFRDPFQEFPLDPSFEPDAEPANPANEEIFGQLQKCSAAKLVVPVGEDHMYFAAMNSKSCRLTALGRRYHRLAAQGRV
jgi:hypothetical protein